MIWSSIKERVYSFVSGMTTANGYNYDWEEYRRDDIVQPEILAGKATFTLEYPDDRPFETDITEAGEYRATQNQRIKSRDFDIKCRVISDMVAVNTEEAIDKNNNALDKALWDIQHALSIDTLNDCGLGILDVQYIDATKESTPTSGVYFPYMLSVNFNIVYKEAR